MAMYKDADITADFIQTKFPSVASAIIASAHEEQPEITADLIREKHPEIAALFVKEGEEKGIQQGAQAEAERLAAIDAAAIPGYEEIVAEAKKDSTKSAEDVKLAIFDAMHEKAKSASSARADDGASLAAKVAELTTEGGDDKSDIKKAEERMALAAKKARGEK